MKKKHQLTFLCTRTGAESENGQYAELSVPLPPPHPVADGQGNPVSQPPPDAGTLVVFITSEARRAALQELDPLLRERKRQRPELAATDEDRAARAKACVELDKQIAALRERASRAGELKLEHGKRYVVTIEEAP